MIKNLKPAAGPREAILDPQLTRPDWTVGAPRDPKLLWLDKNEALDPELLKVNSDLMREVPATALATYPDCAPLYHKLAAYLGVPAHNLLLTAGSDGVIRAVFETFVSHGDTVVHTSPTFAMYPVYCRMFGAKSVTLDYAPSASGPRLTADTVVETIATAQAKLLCLPNPDSPTGTIFTPEDMRRIIAAAAEAGTLVLIDEAYHPYYDWTALPWINEYSNIVIARTFAKAWGLAGMRIGYAAACPELTKLLHKVRPLYEVNSVAVAVVMKLLDRTDAMDNSVWRLNAGRDTFLAAMDALSLPTIHAKGNFLHVKFGEKAPSVHAALQDLALYRKDSSEPCLKGYTRFSATTVELFQPLVRRIQQVFGQKA